MQLKDCTIHKLYELIRELGELNSSHIFYVVCKAGYFVCNKGGVVKLPSPYITMCVFSSKKLSKDQGSLSISNEYYPYAFILTAYIKLLESTNTHTRTNMSTVQALRMTLSLLHCSVWPSQKQKGSYH